MFAFWPWAWSHRPPGCPRLFRARSEVGFPACWSFGIAPTWHLDPSGWGPWSFTPETWPAGSVARAASRVLGPPGWCRNASRLSWFGQVHWSPWSWLCCLRMRTTWGRYFESSLSFFCKHRRGCCSWRSGLFRVLWCHSSWSYLVLCYPGCFLFLPHHWICLSW